MNITPRLRLTQSFDIVSARIENAYLWQIVMFVSQERPEEATGSQQPSPSRAWESFRYLNIAQFIGAMNDNTFKLLLAFCFIQLEGAASSNRILSIAGAVYVLPFILMSTSAGILADKYSKKKIIVFTRVAEIIVLFLGMAAFALQSQFLSFTALFLLAAHSAIFGPCKYGIVPEIVPKESISKANGILSSFSYVAIIVGTFLASFLADITNRNFIVALIFCCVFSLIAIIASFRIQATPPAGSHKKVTPWLLKEMIENLEIIRNEPSLLSAVLGSAFFLFVGSYVQLNMIPFAMKTLHLSDVQGGYMFLLTAFGIGIGSLMAGKLSGKAVEFGLVPVGGIGMSIACICLDYYSSSLSTVLVLVFLIGLFGGLYLVPLDSYIQVASPKTHRGQIVATGNVLGFLGVLTSALAMYVLSEIVGLAPDQGFTVVGIVTLLMAISISISMSGYVIRFFSLVMSYFFFPGSLKGKELIPLDKPSVFLVPQSFWPWAAVLLASQRRRMRLFTLAPQSTPPFPANIARRMIPILELHDIHEIAPTGESAEKFRHAIERGISIAIFCSKRTLSNYAHPLITAWEQEPVLKDVRFFTVSIPEGSEGTAKTGKLSLSAQIEEL
jgi:acyl-[acyl-carrier-protein]-phospholipid O-acyltransferase / long-chain-fatty-acid--[acyl-carrier-protein] ligase